VTQDRGRLTVLFSLYVVVGRAAVFFFILSVLLFLLYILGNFQEFLDATQLYLLGLLRVSLLAELFAGLLYIISVFLVRRERRRARRLVLCACSMVFSYVLLVGLSFLAAWFHL
jgi:hypothetical protein